MTESTIFALQRTYMSTLRTCAIFAGLSQLSKNKSLLIVIILLIILSMRDYYIAYNNLKINDDIDKNAQGNIQMYSFSLVLIFIMIILYLDKDL